MFFKEAPFYTYNEPDATLIVDEVSERTFEVHAYILAAQSKYFQTALQSGSPDALERRIRLPQISSTTAVFVLEWLYRAPLRSPIRDISSDESVQMIKDLVAAFELLEISGPGRDYARFLEEQLLKVGPDHRLFQYDGQYAVNLVTILNEVYRIGGSVAIAALQGVVKAVLQRGEKKNGFLTTLMTAAEDLKNPDGRCWRDFSIAMASVLNERLESEK